MDATFYYHTSSGSWAEYGNLISPLQIGDLLTNDTSTSYNVSIRLTALQDTLVLTPGTICKIAFASREFQFVVIDGGRITPSIDANPRLHSYVVQEALNYLREVYVQTAYFSYGQYTLAQFIERLFALSDCDYTLTLSTGYDYTTLSDNWNGADFQVSSNSLLDNIVKLGQNNGVRFRGQINASGQFELYVKSLEGSETITEINGTKIGDTRQYQGSNYASKVVANIENFSKDQQTWYPSMAIYARGMRAEPETDYESSLTKESAVLKYPYNIKSISNIRILGFGHIITDSPTPWPGYSTSDDYRVYDNDGNLIEPDDAYHYVSIDWDLEAPANGYLEWPCYEEKEWAQLDPDDSDGATYHQANTAYYVREESKLKNIGIFDTTADDFGISSHATERTKIYRIDLYISGVYTSYENIYAKYYWHKNRFLTLANFNVSSIFALKNANSNKRIAYYSQEENLVSGKALLGNAQTYIDSMQNENVVLSYKFADMADVPEAGQIYNGMVIASVVMEVRGESIFATLSLSDDVVKKSEFMSADAGLNLPTISTNKTYDRVTNYISTLWLCESASIANSLVTLFGGDQYLYKSNAHYIFDGLSNGRTNSAWPVAEMKLKTGASSSDYQYTASPVVFGAANESIYCHFQTLDNVSVGAYRDATLGSDFDDLRFYPVSFIATANGKSDAIEIKFDMLKTISDNYPAISASEFSTDNIKLASIIDSIYYHDPAERIKITYQINAKVYNRGGKIRQAFFEDGYLFTDYISGDLYQRKMWFTPDGGSQTALGNIVSASFTLVSTYIYKLRLESATAISTGVGSLIIKRQLISDSSYETLLTARATAVVSAGYYLDIYIAFTK